MESVDIDEASPTDTDNWSSSIRAITDGAIFHFAINVLSKGIKFLLNLLLTNALGVGLYGMYTFGRMILRSLLTFTNLGTDVALTRLLSANLEDSAYQNRVFFLSYFTTFCASLLASAAVVIAAPLVNEQTLGQPAFTTVLRIFGLAIPFVSLTSLASNSFRGLERPFYTNLLTLVNPVVKLVVIATVIFAGYSLLGTTVAFGVASVLAFLLATYLVVSRTDLRPATRLSREEIKRFYNYSIPLSASRAGSLLYKRVDILMVGFFLSSKEVGIYGVALLVSDVITMPLIGFIQLFPPVASRLYSNDESSMLQMVFATVTRWIITVTLLISISLVIYRREVLQLFGDGFTEGAMILTLFVAGQTVNAAVGPSNVTLSMTDHQYVVMMNHWTFGVLNVILNYYLIMQFGLVGAAVATAGTLALLNVCRLVEVWYFEGLFPYSTRLWKPFTAAAGAAAVMYASTMVLSGLPLLIVGAGAGALVYACMLYVFGIEQQDKDLAEEYLSLLG